MSVTQITKELEAMHSAFESFKSEYVTQFKNVCGLENTFMNAIEYLDSYVSSETTKLLNMLSNHTEFVNTFKREYDTNKFEEGNFNRVSIIKKQDDTIKTLEIKVAELEMRLASAEKNQPRQTVAPVKDAAQPIISASQPDPIKHQCYARVGKAKYNISKQASDFMTEFPEGTFITKTGCVVGLPCANTVPHTNVLFCSEHNTGKFEDIRTEPGTPQAPITQIPTAVSVEQQQVEKKKPSTRKKKDQVITAPEPVVVVDVTTPEPVVVVDVTAPEPVVAVVPALNITFEQEEILDDQSPPLSPVVDISTVCTGIASQCNATASTPNLQFHRSHSGEMSLEFSVGGTIEQFVQPETHESVNAPETHELSQDSSAVIEPPSFDDIEFYDDPTTGKTYYLDSKTKRIFEIAPNDEIGVFVKQL